MQAVCCICGKAVDTASKEKKNGQAVVDVAEDNFIYHRDRPSCRNAVRRMKRFLKMKHLERWGGEEILPPEQIPSERDRMPTSRQAAP